MVKFEDKVYLKHILEAISKIESYIKDYSFEDFSKDNKTIDAVARELGIIGEAANNVSKLFQEGNSQIPWSKIISMRNFLIHQYFGIDKQTIWQTCRNNLPELKKQIEETLE